MIWGFFIESLAKLKSHTSLDQALAITKCNAHLISGWSTINMPNQQPFGNR
jgi:hypothetical protein